jgi:hypothetical protein
LDYFQLSLFVRIAETLGAPLESEQPEKPFESHIG